MNPLITDYLTEILATRSPKTAEDYQERLKRFSAFLRDRPFTRQVAVNFLLSLREKQFGEASISLHQSTLKSFYGWLASTGAIAQNFMDVAPLPAYRSNHRDNDFPFTEDEYGRIKAACLKIQNADHLFWHDAVVAAWNTGLRLRDIAFLNRSQVDLAERKITVIPNKTRRFNKAVEIPILPELFETLERNTCVPLFFPEMASSYGKSGNKALSVFFGRLLKSLEIEGKSFHSFRHRFSSALLNVGTPVSVVSSITGQTMKTLQRYSHVPMEDKRRAMQMMS